MPVFLPPKCEDCGADPGEHHLTWCPFSEARGGEICPFCGAYSTSQCEYEDDTEVCPWEASEPDPDHMRDLRDER